MWTYDPPLREMRFVLERVLNAPASWAACPALAETDLDTAGAVLEEGARFAVDRLLPLNARGDAQGCSRDEQGRVRTPEGFRAAYQDFVAGGWPALACDPAWGGQGLPLLVDAALREMLSACNHGWTMYPDLLHGAYETLLGHADDALKARYLTKIASGEWLAAMALTEPQAGSDLGLLRTRALPRPDGSLQVSGSKLFISGGEHDLTDNIVHLVLCRLEAPGQPAPPGTRGLSLALVPKVLPDGSRNTLFCDGLEHKMGLHGSATCAMRYESATGWLVGEPHRGLAAMFLMMNSARLHVGLQGLGHQEVATQNALRHALERPQGRALPRLPARATLEPAGLPHPGPDPIASHAAVRHLLLRLQAHTEAQRVIAYRAAQCLDEAHHHADPARRERAARQAALLTPVVKAWLTRQGFDSASLALQVHGGYGYVREYGIEQTLRDARITMIYEGTNEIQAIDLLLRKLLGDGGLAFGELLEDLGAEAARCAGDAALVDFGAGLQHQIDQARAAAAALLGAPAASDPEAPLRLADDWLAGVAHLLLSWAWAASARAARAEPDADWAAAKTARMRYGLDWLLPAAEPHWRRLRGGGPVLPGILGA